MLASTIINKMFPISMRQLRRDNVAVVNGRKASSQEKVFQAVGLIGKPVNGRAVARFMGVDSASVTNRLAELTKQRRLKVAHIKKGLDGMWRQYYVVNTGHISVSQWSRTHKVEVKVKSSERIWDEVS